MRIRGLVWLGTRTDAFREMAAFVTETLGIPPTLQLPDFLVADLPNGDRLEVFGPSDSGHSFMTCPVVGFLVDDVHEARRELEEKGVEFLGPVHETEEGYAWSHFRAPDGRVYELTRHPGHPAYGS